VRHAITDGLDMDPSALNLTGCVAIDPVTHTFRVGGLEAKNADDRRVDPTIDPGHVRYSVIEGDLLKTTIENAGGATTATATWKKAG
jgi:hypothetical protein